MCSLLGSISELEARESIHPSTVSAARHIPYVVALLPNRVLARLCRPKQPMLQRWPERGPERYALANSQASKRKKPMKVRSCYGHSDGIEW